jgi:IclR family mhp operon transcriptional activator
MHDSTRPIRALLRGLDALAALNVRNGSTVSDMAADIKVPRTTAYRVLETLCLAGYVFRDPADDRYRLTVEVRRLSDGFDDEAWVSQTARPVLLELCAETAWPVSLLTLSGTTMVARETTDPHSRLALERDTAGTRLPLLTSAAGRAHLAWCPKPERAALIDILSRSPREEDALARNPGELGRILNEAREQGYVSAVRARRVADEVSLAVPIALEDRVLACLTLRFSASAVPVKMALERFVPRLQHAARRIRAQFVAQRGGIGSSG